jgi:hypothetical protein
MASNRLLGGEGLLPRVVEGVPASERATILRRPALGLLVEEKEDSVEGLQR